MWNSWGLSRHALGLAGILASLLFSARGAPAAEGEDEVRVSARSGERVVRGTIVDYSGAELRLRLPTGQESRYEGAQVLEVRYTRSAEQESGDEARRRHAWQEAIDHYLRAAQSEQRGWVRRQLLVEMAPCYANLGDVVRAGDAFQLVVQSDPATPYYDRIPLQWTVQVGAPEVQRRAAEWLGAEQGAVRLLGASWLLGTSRNDDAVGALRGLLNDADGRTLALAEAQLWRTRLVVADAAEVERWWEATRRLPESLRGGPDYLVGLALARLGDSRRSARSLLRAPIHHPESAALASESLLAAAGQLTKIGEVEEARGLYTELLQGYPDTQAAAAAASAVDSK